MQPQRFRNESKLRLIDVCHKTSIVKSNLPLNESDHGWAPSARSSPTTNALQNLQNWSTRSCSGFTLISDPPAALTGCRAALANGQIGATTASGRSSADTDTTINQVIAFTTGLRF
jgi:hypothetical protein